MEVGGLILVKDDAELLRECLVSLGSAVDEIVVVDNGSSDGSARVAESFGCRVVTVPDAILDRARNFGIAALATDWILVIDADERVSENSKRALRATIGEVAPDVLALTTRRLDYFGDGRWAEPTLLRLFRNTPGMRYGDSPIHGSLLPAVRELGGSVEAAPIVIHHLDGLIPGRSHSKKRLRYVRMLRDEIARHPADPFLQLLLARELLGLGHFAALERACAGAADVYKGGDDGNAHDARAVSAARDLMRAYSFLAKGDGQGALEALQAGAGLLTEDHEATGFVGDATLVAAARAAVSLGDRETARTLLRRALDISWFSPATHINLAFLLRDESPHEAMRHLDVARQQNEYLDEAFIYGARSARTVHEMQDAFVPGVPHFPELRAAVLRASACSAT